MVLSEISALQVEESRLRHLFLAQIQKDFLLAGVDADFIETDQIDEAIELTRNWVEHLVNKDIESFYRLLYIVDVPQEKLDIAVEDLKPMSYSDVSSLLILQRELKKVELKLKYSQN